MDCNCSCNTMCSSAAFFGGIGVWYVWRSLNKHTRKLSSPSTSASSSESQSGDVGYTNVEPLALPVIDVAAFMNKVNRPDYYEKECAKLSDALQMYGCAVIRDPRVDYDFNNTFLDMMERYFTLSDGVRDARPQYHYQVGVTPERIERARDHCKAMGAYRGKDKPLSPCPPELDAKWRFFWRVGPTPKSSRFPSLNMDPVIPPEIPEWKDVMDSWGSKMLASLFVVAEMAAVGFELPSDAFTSRMQFGPHLLAPTGSDLSKYGKNKQVLAGFHTDLNFLTIHGKSRYPGLYVWTRQGEKKQVKVPDGCLLVQAGKQIEYLTGGHVKAGFHEVVVNENTMEVIKRRKQEGKPLWRVSSTLFGHIASDQTLEPLGRFNTPEAVEVYPPVYAGDQVQNELKLIKLH